MKTKQYRPRWNTTLIPYIKQIKKLSSNEQLQFFKKTLDDYANNNTITEDNHSNNKTLESKISHRIKTLDDLIEVSKIDLKEWTIDRHIINKWDVGTKVNDEVIVEELYQVKVWLKKNVEIVDAEKVRNDILKDIKSYSPVVKKLNYKKNKKYIT
jgi:hypothetical protein